MATSSTYPNPAAGGDLAHGEPLRGGHLPGRSTSDQTVAIYKAMRSALGASPAPETAGAANLEALTGATSAIQAAADDGVLTSEEARAAMEWMISRFAESRIERIWAEYWTHLLDCA